MAGYLEHVFKCSFIILIDSDLMVDRIITFETKKNWTSSSLKEGNLSVCLYCVGLTFANVVQNLENYVFIIACFNFCKINSTFHGHKYFYTNLYFISVTTHISINVFWYNSMLELYLFTNFISNLFTNYTIAQFNTSYLLWR